MKRKQTFPTQIRFSKVFIPRRDMKVNQNLSIIALDLADIDEEEILMFYDINKTPNLDLPYWKYERFDLDALENLECVTDFDFKNMIHTI